jgi:hypothetical protein
MPREKANKCGTFKVGQLVRMIGVPDAVGLVTAIDTAQAWRNMTDTEYHICWLKVLWTDLGPPANWERAEWLRHIDEFD